MIFYSDKTCLKCQTAISVKVLGEKQYDKVWYSLSGQMFHDF